MNSIFISRQLEKSLQGDFALFFSPFKANQASELKEESFLVKRNIKELCRWRLYCFIFLHLTFQMVNELWNHPF